MHLVCMKLVGTVFLAMAAVQPAPPPVPAIYDPYPGPFVIFAGESDELDDQSATIASAVAAWSADEDERLGAFLLCFRQPEASELTARTRQKALQLTADALLDAGARVVTVGTKFLCDAIPQIQLPDSLQTRPRVEVRGVMRVNAR